MTAVPNVLREWSICNAAPLCSRGVGAVSSQRSCCERLTAASIDRCERPASADTSVPHIGDLIVDINGYDFNSKRKVMIKANSVNIQTGHVKCTEIKYDYGSTSLTYRKGEVYLLILCEENITEFDALCNLLPHHDHVRILSTYIPYASVPTRTGYSLHVTDQISFLPWDLIQIIWSYLSLDEKRNLYSTCKRLHVPLLYDDKSILKELSTNIDIVNHIPESALYGIFRDKTAVNIINAYQIHLNPGYYIGMRTRRRWGNIATITGYNTFALCYHDYKVVDYNDNFIDGYFEKVVFTPDSLAYFLLWAEKTWYRGFNEALSRIAPKFDETFKVPISYLLERGEDSYIHQQTIVNMFRYLQYVLVIHVLKWIKCRKSRILFKALGDSIKNINTSTNRPNRVGLADYQKLNNLLLTLHNMFR